MKIKLKLFNPLNSVGGFVELELVSILVVFAIIIDISFSFITISKSLKKQLEIQNKLETISVCIQGADDDCKPLKKRQFSILYSCQKQIMNFKPYCSYFKESTE